MAEPAQLQAAPSGSPRGKRMDDAWSKMGDLILLFSNAKHGGGTTRET